MRLAAFWRRKIKTRLLWGGKLFLIFSFLLTCFQGIVLAESIEDQFNKKREEIKRLESKIAQLQNQAKTLKGQISYMNSQIELTSLKISQTETQIEILNRQIDELSEKIGILNTSLNEISVLFINRVIATYKAGKISSLNLLLSSKGFADFFRKTQYLRAAQMNDRQTLVTMEEIRANYDRQKEKKEEKQKELEELKLQLARQKADLDQQKKDKEYLLAITQNDEKRYQELMARALAELQAIQAIIAGKGEEREVGEVKEGEEIATVISGGCENGSVCSSGTHLHFEVRDGDFPRDPAQYLRPISVIWDNQPDGPFSFSGSWNWPMNEPIRITQGYGETFYSRRGYYRGSPHTGIDLVSNDVAVKAVKDGVLYNGSISCCSYCSSLGKKVCGNLRYVRVKHKESNISTYYLHVNYEKL